MTPPAVRAALLARALERVGSHASLWYASAAACALSWRPGPDGRPVLAPPTRADVEALASGPEAEFASPAERADALELLRSIASG